MKLGRAAAIRWTIIGLKGFNISMQGGAAGRPD
jgi:hypothetical protein